MTARQSLTALPIRTPITIVAAPSSTLRRISRMAGRSVNQAANYPVKPSATSTIRNVIDIRSPSGSRYNAASGSSAPTP